MNTRITTPKLTTEWVGLRHTDHDPLESPCAYEYWTKDGATLHCAICGARSRRNVPITVGAIITRHVDEQTVQVAWVCAGDCRARFEEGQHLYGAHP